MRACSRRLRRLHCHGADTGEITNPRDMDMDDPEFTEPESLTDIRPLLLAPRDFSQDRPEKIELEKDPNSQPLPSYLFVITVSRRTDVTWEFPRIRSVCKNV